MRECQGLHGMGVLQNPRDLKQVCQKRGCCSPKNISKMLPGTMTISNKCVKHVLLKTADQKEVFFSLFFSNFPPPFLFLHLIFFLMDVPQGKCPSEPEQKTGWIMNFCY